MNNRILFSYRNKYPLRTISQSLVTVLQTLTESLQDSVPFFLLSLYPVTMFYNC